MFYVYALTDPRNNDRFFYIGKGHGYRAINHLKNSANRENNSKQATVKAIRNDGYEPGVVYLFKQLTEEQAHQKEIELIAFYGRKDLGLGHLTNLTNGGEGTSGHKHTEETKKKMREADRSAYNRTAPVSEETKAKLSALLTGKPGRTKGHKWTEEQKTNLSKVRVGSKCPTKGKKRVYREDGSFYFA
jgi:hypothetical protein